MQVPWNAGTEQVTVWAVPCSSGGTKPGTIGAPATSLVEDTTRPLSSTTWIAETFCGGRILGSVPSLIRRAEWRSARRMSCRCSFIARSCTTISTSTLTPTQAKAITMLATHASRVRTDQPRQNLTAPPCPPRDHLKTDGFEAGAGGGQGG